MRDIMDRRELLGVLGVGAAGLVALRTSQAHADDEETHDDPVKTLGECAKLCDEVAHHCLDELRQGGSHADLHDKAHEAAMDCQAFCVLTATLMARKSPVAKYAHLGSAAACANCADACEGRQGNIMKECVKICRECEKLCRRLSAGVR
jgi:hypothetical protein